MFTQRLLEVGIAHQFTLEDFRVDLAVAAQDDFPALNDALKGRVVRGQPAYRRVQRDQGGCGDQAPCQGRVTSRQPVGNRFAQQQHHDQVKRGELTDRAFARQPDQDKQAGIDHAGADHKLPPRQFQVEQITP